MGPGSCQVSLAEGTSSPRATFGSSLGPGGPAGCGPWLPRPETFSAEDAALQVCAAAPGPAPHAKKRSGFWRSSIEGGIASAVGVKEGKRDIGWKADFAAKPRNRSLDPVAAKLNTSRV